jgi:hypothetical protein
MRNVSDKKAVEKIKTYFTFNLFIYLFLENRAVHATVWKNILEPGRPQTTIWCMLDT